MNDDDKIKMPVTILLRHSIKKFCHYIKFTLKKVRVTILMFFLKKVACSNLLYELYELVLAKFKDLSLKNNINSNRQ